MFLWVMKRGHRRYHATHIQRLRAFGDVRLIPNTQIYVFGKLEKQKWDFIFSILKLDFHQVDRTKRFVRSFFVVATNNIFRI